MKVIISESQYNRLIDNFITFLFEPHEVKTRLSHPNSIFWVRNGNVIATLDSDNIWTSNIIWQKISDQFGLDYRETKSVIKTWLEQHYRLGRLSPLRVFEYEWSLFKA